MLYRAVFGPELAAIFDMIVQRGHLGVTRGEVYETFIPGYSLQAHVATQTVDDALAFLSAAHLAYCNNGMWLFESLPIPTSDFRIRTLFQLRQIQAGELPARHQADPTYMLLLEELFVKPRLHMVHDMMVQANRLDAVQLVGGLNREKLQGWRRVMCYLGMGVQVNGEFLFAPDADLVLQLICLAGQQQGSLQELVEGHLSKFVPCSDSTGDLAPAIEQCFESLQKAGCLKLFTQQDAPSRPFGSARYRGYRVTPA